jgi:nitroreductase/Pyruvate/2-oxoacid:ferredoxin oxidoreductase delta subunit
MLNFTVNDKRCTRCGQCVLDCPSRIIVQKGTAVPVIAPEHEVRCIQCQHCLAVCPSAAISILGRSPEGSLPVSPDVLPRLDQMTRLVRSRRSVRRYKDANVDPALIRDLLATLANAPSGVNRRELNFILIDDKAVLNRFRERLMTDLAVAAEGERIPESFAYLHNAVPAWFKDRQDVIFRGAPHLLIVAAPPDAPCPHEDVAIALAFFDLLAQSAGLGTVWCGMLKMALETLPDLKPLLGLPHGHHYYPMLFGTPAVKYARTVQRDDAAPVKRVSL